MTDETTNDMAEAPRPTKAGNAVNVRQIWIRRIDKVQFLVERIEDERIPTYHLTQQPTSMAPGTNVNPEKLDLTPSQIWADFDLK